MILYCSKDNVPVVIIRPTVITSTYKEPFPGWIQGFRLCEGRKPLGGSDLFQVHSHDAVSNSQQGKNAMGASLQACGCHKDVETGRKVHNLAEEEELVLVECACNALIAMYGKCGSVEDTANVFEIMPEKNLVSWNSTICGFSENGLDHESYSLLGKILEELFDSIITGYGKGRLTCLLADPMSVFDMVSSSSINPPTHTYILCKSACMHIYMPKSMHVSLYLRIRTCTE
ncbi:hypothetical protein ACFX2F_028223 [Malus domestica]